MGFQFKKGIAVFATALMAGAVLVGNTATAQVRSGNGQQIVIKEKILNREVGTFAVQVNEKNFVRLVSASGNPKVAFESELKPGCTFWKDKPVGTRLNLNKLTIQYESGAKNNRLTGVNNEDICGRFYFARVQPMAGG